MNHQWKGVFIMADKTTDALARQVASRLGITEEELTDKLQQGDLVGLLGKEGAGKINSILKDKALTEKILQSKEAAALLKKFSKE